MAAKMRGLSTAGLKVISVLVVYSLVSQAAVPTGWHLQGSKPLDYESTIDPQAEYDHHASVLLRAKNPVVDGFGTLMQQFRADRYEGKRVRFSGFVKADRLQDWAGLWMRIDKGTQMVAFDNMSERPIRGTQGWQNYEVVLDVPQDATGIAFGVLLSGSGTVWLNHTKFEVVETNVPTTGIGLSVPAEGPANLDFEN
jgi:hypothetical protein